MVRFVRFSYYKTAYCTALCGVVRCGALLLAVRCGYAVLWVILVWFLRFVQFGEHPYPNPLIRPYHFFFCFFFG